MNPVDIYQFFTTLIRDGAEVIAAALIGLGIGVVAGWRVYGWWVKKTIDDLVKEKADLTTMVFQAKEDNTRLQNQVTKQMEEIGRLSAELTHLRADFKIQVEMEVTKRTAALRAELDPLKIECATLQKTANDLKVERANLEAERDTLKAETSRLTTDNDRLNGLKDQYRTERNRARQQAEEAEQSRKKAEQDKDTATEWVTKVGAERDNARKEALELRQLYDKEKLRTREMETIRGRVVVLEREVGKWRSSVQEAEKKFDETEVQLTATQAELEETRAQRDKERERADQLEQQIQAVQARTGKIWERPVPSTVPRFVPLGPERRCPVISLLSLKGGVGKTTLALNIAATLSDRKQRVLMIDGDHQRSLSALCLPGQRRVALHHLKRTLQHFLLGPDRSQSAFLHSVHPLPNMQSCSVLVNTASHDDDEGLGNVEDTLMLDWLFSQGQQDIRHALRGAIHTREVAERFDYILIDCPPRLSTATINALAVSDFLLIPVVLDDVSATNPLPLLLRELRRLHGKPLFPQFKILGVVANRVQTGKASSIVGKQWPVWEALPLHMGSAWGEPVHRFETMITQTAAYSKAAKVLLKDTDRAVVIWEDSNAQQLFSDLTDEIEQRIANEAPDLAAVHS